jgi:6-pyruvoyl-tetrahydropterin synthase
MKTELLLKFVFEASHSLEGYEVVHPHIWRLELGLTGEPIRGRIVDIVDLRKGIQKRLDYLVRTNLNENPFVSGEVRSFPTCETLSQYFLEDIEDLVKHDFAPQNASIQVSSVLVAICDMDGTETGAVRRTRS